MSTPTDKTTALRSAIAALRDKGGFSVSRISTEAAVPYHAVYRFLQYGQGLSDENALRLKAYIDSHAATPLPE